MDQPAQDFNDQLVEAYDGLERRFLDNGLDTAGVAAARASFTRSDTGVASPIPYRKFEPIPYPPAAVRLLVAPLSLPDNLATPVRELVARIQGLSAMAVDTLVYPNPEEQLHVTLFHTSQPSDPRPDPLHPPAFEQTLTPQARPGPSPETLAAERAALVPIASSTDPFSFEFYKAVMADSGVLLLCWLEPKGAVSDLRGRLREAFPGAPRKQASILHTTLLRILTPTPLPSGLRTAIAAECASWGRDFGKARVDISRLWYIPDSEAATVALGDRVGIDLTD